VGRDRSGKHHDAAFTFSRFGNEKETFMPTVASLVAHKGEHIHAIAPSATVFEAVRQMNEHQIGALVVMRDERVVGMFTERDVLRRVMAENRSPRQVIVGEVMTTDVICCRPDADVEEASRIMKDRRVRHLPICDGDGNLHGLISIGDLNAFYASTQEQTINHLTDYIYGRV
jgi:CBS domain-containing protein